MIEPRKIYLMFGVTTSAKKLIEQVYLMFGVTTSAKNYLL